jgi:hypothetical protein
MLRARAKLAIAQFRRAPDLVGLDNLYGTTLMDERADLGMRYGILRSVGIRHESSAISLG